MVRKHATSGKNSKLGIKQHMYNDRLEQAFPWTLYRLSMCLSPDGFIEYIFPDYYFQFYLSQCMYRVNSRACYV